MSPARARSPLLRLGPLAVVLLVPLAAVQTAHAEGSPSERAIVPPPPPGTVRIAWATDTQFGGQREGLRAAVDWFRLSGAMTLVFTGDTNYALSEVPPDWLDALGPYARESRLLLTYGTHDAGRSYLAFMPSDHGATWWSAKVGSAIVVGLDSNQQLAPGSPQFVWLDTLLAGHKDKQVVLAIHIPWWVVNSYHDEDKWFVGDAAAMDALIVRHDVDLVLAGHTHYYSRMEREGATFVIGGPTDAMTRSVPPSVADASEVSFEKLTSALFDIGADAIRGIALDSKGRIVDEFRVAEPAPVTGGGAITPPAAGAPEAPAEEQTDAPSPPGPAASSSKAPGIPAVAWAWLRARTGLETLPLLLGAAGGVSTPLLVSRHAARSLAASGNEPR